MKRTGEVQGLGQAQGEAKTIGFLQPQRLVEILLFVIYFLD